MIVSTIVIILLVLLGIVLLCLATVWIEKKFPGKQYDERQILARSKAHRLAYWVGFVYSLIILPILIRQVYGEKTVEPYLLVLAGCMLQALVMHTYCLITNAALPLSQNPEPTIASFTVIGIVNLLSFRVQLDRCGILLPVGSKTLPYSSLITGICFLYLAALHLIQAFRKDED